MNVTHDPYLNTVKRSIDEERIKNRKKNLELEKENGEKNDFFSKNIDLNRILDLPDGVQQFILFGLFLFVPYLVGSVFMFITQQDMSSFQNESINKCLLLWTIGYELIASFFIFIFIQQAFSSKARK